MVSNNFITNPTVSRNSLSNMFKQFMYCLSHPNTGVDFWCDQVITKLHNLKKISKHRLTDMYNVLEFYTDQFNNPEQSLRYQCATKLLNELSTMINSTDAVTVKKSTYQIGLEYEQFIVAYMNSREGSARYIHTNDTNVYNSDVFDTVDYKVIDVKYRSRISEFNSFKANTVNNYGNPSNWLHLGIDQFWVGNNQVMYIIDAESVRAYLSKYVNKVQPKDGWTVPLSEVHVLEVVYVV